MGETIEDLRAALAEARQERDALRALVENLPIAVTTFSPDGTVMGHNRAAADNAVFPPEKLAGATLSELAALTGQDPATLAVRWSRTPEGLSERQDYVIPHPDGHKTISQVHTLRLPDRTFAISQDVTDERDIVARLKESEERLRQFFDASVEGIIFREGAWIVDANEAAARMIGVSVEQLRSQPILDIVAPVDRAKGMRLMARQPQSYKITAIRADGSTFPVEVHAKELDDSGHGRRVICFLDVSRQEEAEARLRESKALFEALSRAAPVGLIQLSADEECRYANEAWQTLTGQTPAEAAGDGWLDAIPDSDRPVCRGLLAASRALRAPTAREYRVQRPGGKIRWVFGQFAPLLDSKKDIAGFVGTLTDITARKSAEEERARTLKQKELLLQEIHHRVKNNLLLVSSLLLLQAQEFSDPVLREAFSASQDRIKAMALLHSNLYATTSVDRVSFGTYTTRLVRSLIASIGRPDVQVHIDVNLQGADDLNVQQAIPCGLIINELLTNSFKHAFPGRGGNIWLRAWHDGQKRRMRVCDDGVGKSREAPASLGTRLVEMLTQQLDGTLSVTATDTGGSQTDLAF